MLLAGLLAAGAAHAQNGPVLADRFSATTTAMEPSGADLRFDVRTWSDEAARADVIAALESGADAAKALVGLPTVGYVWKDGSSVGYSMKYAHRESSPDGNRVTFVTEKVLGTYDLEPWSAAPAADAQELGYSVIELYLTDGTGSGSMSLAAKVQIDAQNDVVSLAEGAPRVLDDVRLEAKPYWAKKH